MGVRVNLYKVTVWTKDLDPFEEANIFDILVIAKDFEEAKKLAFQYFEKYFDEVEVEDVEIIPLKEASVLGVISPFAIGEEG